MTNDAPTLLPCPCGAAVSLVTGAGRTVLGLIVGYWVACVCGAYGPFAEIDSEAVARWNARTG